MDNYSVPNETPPPEGAALPLGPSVTSIPEPEDNLPPGPPDVEDAHDAPSTAEVQPEDGPFETADLADALPQWLSPVVCVAIGAAAGFALALVISRNSRFRV